MEINTGMSWAIRQREMLLRFSYITFARIWNFETFSVARGHENTNLFIPLNDGEHTNEFKFYYKLNGRSLYFLFDTRHSTSNVADQFDMIAKRTHEAPILLNCEC